MGLVIKKPVSAQQLAEQIQNAETQAALDNINLAIKDERNARSSEDINLRRDINFLQETLTEEISARTAAENIIKSDLLTETNQRTAADSTLQAAIDAEKTARETENSNLRDAINTAVANEQAARTQGLQDLQNAVSVAMGNAQRLQEIENENLRRQLEAEAASQGTTLAALNERLATEEQTRAAEDTRLANSISAESAARQTAITNAQSTLNTAINKEVSDRQAAVSDLSTALTNTINTEIQNRKNADTALENSLKEYVDGEISSVGESLNDFTAPTTTAAGKRGLVPAPAAGADLKLLTNYGWRSAGDTTLTISNVPSQAAAVTFNGSSQSPAWLNFDDKKLSISGETSGTNAKNYTVTFTPVDIYLWEDTLDQSPKTATWTIQPLKLAKPTAPVTTFTFNNAAQGISVSNFDSTYESQTGTVSATNANSYSATYKLKNTTNTKWSDNSTADVVINWTISPLKLAKPTAAVTEFDCDGTTHTLQVSNFNSTYINQTGTISAAATGDYTATFSLKNTSNTKWSDNSTAAVNINWTVANRTLTAAQSSGFAQLGTLNYTGNSQNVSVQNFDENYHVLSGTTSAANAGNYTAYVKPASGFTWNDGTNGLKTVNWTIKPMVLQKPTTPNNYFEYDGEVKTLTVQNYNSAHMTQQGTVSTAEAGQYTVTYSLNSTSNYVWADNSVANVILTWQVGALLLPKPSLTNNHIQFTATAEAPANNTKQVVFENFNEDYMTVSGQYDALPGGGNSYRCCFPNVNIAYAEDRSPVPYRAVFTLKNTNRTKWADGSTAPVTVEWWIDPIRLSSRVSNDTPNPSHTEYTGDYIDLASFFTYLSQNRIVEITVKQVKDAGTYTSYYRIAHYGYVWYDGTEDDKAFTFTVTPKKVTKPTLKSSSFHYTGSQIILTADNFNNFDPDVINLSGNSATNIGSYSVTVSLKNTTNYCWADSSNAALELSWNITGDSVSLNPNSLRISDSLTYSGDYMTPEITNFDSTKMTLGGQYSKKDAGTYTLTVSLKAGYTWSDGSTSAQSLEWTVSPLVLDAPTVSQTQFAYNNSTVNINDYISGFNSNYMSRSGDFSKKDVGSYSVTISLKDKVNIKWSNGSTDDIVIEWSIGLTSVAVPRLSSANFTYNGNVRTPAISGFDSNLMTSSGDTSALNAGNYSVTVALKDKTMYVWDDGSSSDKELTWQIKRKPLTATQGNLSQSGTLTYNGSSQTVTITNYSASYHNLGGAYISTNAGEYVAQIEPLPNYCWNDNTFAPKYVTWTINPIKLAKPTAAVTEFTYDKNAHALAVQNFNADYMNQTGSISATNAGSYSAVYSLKNSNNTVWADNSIANVYIAWNISKQTLAKPTLSTSSFVYSGSNRTVTVNNFNSTYMSQSGVTQAKDAGTYELTFSFNDPSLVNWEDGTNSDVTLTWKITRAAMTTARSNPYQSTIPTFTNSAKSLSATYITGYYSSQQVWSGTTSATNAGEYTAYVEPNSNYTWVDGSVSKKTVKWSIAPAQISPPTVSDSVTLTYNETAQSPTLTGYDSSKMTLGGDTSKTDAGNYTLTVTPKNSNYVWDTGDSDAVSLDWKINYYVLSTLPKTLGGPHAYFKNKTITVGTSMANSTSGLFVTNFDSETMVASGDWSGKNPGSYQLIVTPKNENHGFYANRRQWTYTWYIEIRRIDLPSLPNNGNRSYTGEEQGPFGEYSSPVFKTSNGIVENKIPELVQITGTQSATAIGNYSITFSLLNKTYASFRLEDSSGNTYYSTDDQTFNWSIGVNQITAPTISTTYFDYDNSNKTVSISGFDSSTMTQTGTTTAKARGFYTVTFSLKDKNATCWSTGGNADIVIEWAIGKKRVNKPALADNAVTEFTYSGSAKTLSVTGYDADSMTQSGYLSATDAGSYTVTYALKNTTEFVWADNTTANVSFSWKINKAALAAVTFSQSGTLTYDGTAKTVTIKNYNASTMDTSSTTSATAAGTYTAKVSPKSNYTWSDGTSTAKSVSWKINKKSLTKPTAANTVFEYDGSAKSLTFSNYDSTYMTQSGTASATDSGSYTVTFTLKSTSNTQWADATTSAVNISWSIGGSYLAIPTVSPASQISKGLTQTHSVTVSGFDSSTMTQTGTVSTSTGKAATYTVTFALKDKTNTAWADGTTTNKAVSWTVTKKVLTAAESTFAQNKSVSYDGNSHSVTEACTAIKSAYIGEYYTLSNATGTNAGSFTSSITPTTAATWNDSTTASKNIEWTITGAATTLNLSSTDVTLTLSASTTSASNNNSQYSQTITFTTNSDGDITISSADEWVAAPRVVGFTGAYTIAASSGSFRIYPVANGETTFTISQAAGTGHAAISKTIKVKVVTARVFLTWARIAALAKSGALTNYMRIGDCATIGTLTGTVGTKTLNNVAVARLIGFNHNSSIEGINRAHFAVFLGNYAGANSIIFDDDYGKNTSNGAADNSFIFYPTYDATYLATFSRGYSISPLRTRCTEFFNILPTDLQNVITACKKYDHGSASTVEDKVWIPSAWEITGNHLPSTVEQYEYWANGNSKAFNSKKYWTRSVWSTTNATSRLDRNAYIDTDGSYELTNFIHTSYGFLPCFTIS